LSGDVALLGFLIDPDRVALRERATLDILARQPTRVPSSTSEANASDSAVAQSMPSPVIALARASITRFSVR
jgi:hypothetical protein